MADAPNLPDNDPMAAEPDDPWLSVHGLSEFVFCPRAGLCLYEQDGEPEDDEPEADVSYLPIHEPRELELALETLMRQFLWVLGGGLAGSLVLMVTAWLTGWIVLWLIAGAALVATMWGLYDRGYWLYEAQRQLALWHEAVPEMPDPDSPRIQEIDWRSLLASEATVIDPPRAYQHPEWRLGGRPWRLLEHGDLRIPVFKHRTPWKDLYPQHLVRMAAYCHLLEIAEGARSPYGVIVKGETFAAVTVPNTARTRAMFREALIAARRTIREAEEVNKRPSPPENPNTCRECPFGLPLRVRSDERYLRHGGPLELHVARDRRRKKYHSHCGDRFGWLPTHERAEALELSDK